MRPMFVFRISLFILEDKEQEYFFVACLNKLCHTMKTLCSLPGTDVFRSEIISPNFAVRSVFPIRSSQVQSRWRAWITIICVPIILKSIYVPNMAVVWLEILLRILEFSGLFPIRISPGYKERDSMSDPFISIYSQYYECLEH